MTSELHLGLFRPIVPGRLLAAWAFPADRSSGDPDLTSVSALLRLRRECAPRNRHSIIESHALSGHIFVVTQGMGAQMRILVAEAPARVLAHDIDTHGDGTALWSSDVSDLHLPRW